MTATEAVRQGVNRKYPDAVPRLVIKHGYFMGQTVIGIDAVVYNHRINHDIICNTEPAGDIEAVQIVSRYLAQKAQELAPLGIRMKHMDTVDQHELMLGILE